MHVGVLQAQLAIHGAESLKDKRRVVRSLKDRLHREHQVSVAEVGALENLSVALVGVTCAAPDGRRAADVLDRVSEKIRKAPGAEVVAMTRTVALVDTLTPADTSIDEQALAGEMLAHFHTDDDASERGGPPA